MPTVPIEVITIDGPSGSGKSTAARLLAQRLGFAYLDTGAMYRAVTLKALQDGLNLRDGASLIELAKQMELDLEPAKAGMRVLICGQDVSDQLRSVLVTENAHFIASRRGVRAQMVKHQRKLARKLGSLVTEGRDQGTAVFPKAQVKFFLDASPAQRAKRRYRQLQEAGESLSYQEVLDALEARDAKDRSRDTGPLDVPEGAIIVDTTDMSIEEMVEHMAGEVARVRRDGQQTEQNNE